MPTVFSHACLFFFASCITPTRFQGVLPFHSPLFVKGSCFNWNLVLISLTSSLSPYLFPLIVIPERKRSVIPAFSLSVFSL